MLIIGRRRLDRLDDRPRRRQVGSGPGQIGGYRRLSAAAWGIDVPPCLDAFRNFCQQHGTQPQFIVRAEAQERASDGEDARRPVVPVAMSAVRLHVADVAYGLARIRAYEIPEQGS